MRSASRAALNRATAMRGQLIFVNGEQVGRIELELPDQVPYRFASLPQYATEEVLADHLAGLGATVRRGLRCSTSPPTSTPSTRRYANQVQRQPFLPTT
jgi:hypothetical protein